MKLAHAYFGFLSVLGLAFAASSSAEVFLCQGTYQTHPCEVRVKKGASIQLPPISKYRAPEAYTKLSKPSANEARASYDPAVGEIPKPAEDSGSSEEKVTQDKPLKTPPTALQIDVPALRRTLAMVRGSQTPTPTPLPKVVINGVVQ